ncbi:tetratricopeptide repeat protein [Streptomyces sp. NPDC056660]|uniref:tetratricopeptide repeat protein n=1 Tax=Streptomyces sp. NPDC056660 TaxID=3345897 RepID=UPI0036A4921A
MTGSANITYYTSPKPATTWPHQVGVLPRQADYFQDRASVQHLQQAVVQGGTTAPCHVLAGMGGVGKTQLAAYHARQMWAGNTIDLLVWISAGTRAAVISAYAQAAGEILGADPTKPEDAARVFLAWLEPKSRREQVRWLVVLDDVVEPADLRGLWPPTSPLGRTLLTTRRRDAALIGSGQRLVPVGLFTSREATGYLSTALASHGRLETPTDLAALAADLDHLPLALSQAAAYILDAALDCASYRTLLNGRGQVLPELLPDPGGLPDDQPVSVPAAWSLSIDRADQLAVGMARPMLQLTAALHANGIPAAVLLSPPALAYITENRDCAAGQAQAHTVTSQDALRALRTLHRLSLVDHVPGNDHEAVRVHQLIQRVTREALSFQQRNRLVRAVADALTDTWPDIERDTALSRALRANTDALTGHSEDTLYQLDGVHSVLFRKGDSLGGAGHYTAAIEHFQHMTHMARHHLGPDHPDTFRTRNTLARGRGVAGDPAGAVAAFTDLLADQQRTLSPDHPDIYDTRYGLAYWLGANGDEAYALTAFGELLADQERTLGPDHPETLATRDGLDYWRATTMSATDAITIFAELLADQERVLGRDHPDTLRNRHNLAIWKGKAGDASGAAAALSELLADRERVLGVDHPGTLHTRHCIAYWGGMAGDVVGAVTAFTQLLANQEHSLGPDHPLSLVTRLDLAFSRGEAGDAVGAVTALVKLLADRERVLGRDHLDTRITRRCLAYWQAMSGDAAGSTITLTGLLASQERALHSDHPDVLHTRRCLSYSHEAGDSAETASALAELLTRDHPHPLRPPYDLHNW